MSSNQTPAVTAPAALQLSEGFRTLLTGLILLHLFAVFVAVASNFRPVSPLRNQLRRVPGVVPYLQMLSMDLAYNFHLTYGEREDVDYLVELDTASPSGTFEQTSARLPSGEWLGIRRRRLHQLGWNVAVNLENEEVASMIAKMLGGSLLAETGATQGHLRCVAHFLVSQEDAAASDPARSDPNHPDRMQPVYLARVWRDVGGRTQLFKLLNTAESPPGARAGPATSSPPPATSSPPPAASVPLPGAN